MNDCRNRSRPWFLLASCACALLAAASCTHSPASAGLVQGQDIELRGRITSVDTSPWAYDGDGLAQVATEGHGAVTLHVPARTNLCRARGLGLFDQLRPGDRVRATGTVTGNAEVTVCVDPSQRLERAD